MTNTQYTQVPWVIRSDNSIETKDGETVASFVDNAQHAHLIAAAPAMYEALRMLIALDPRCHRGVEHCGECGACLGQTALAQAEGHDK